MAYDWMSTGNGFLGESYGQTSACSQDKVEGRRLVYSNRCGRVMLNNVTVENQGVDWGNNSNVYWQHKVSLTSGIFVFDTLWYVTTFKLPVCHTQGFVWSIVRFTANYLPHCIVIRTFCLQQDVKQANCKHKVSKLVGNFESELLPDFQAMFLTARIFLLLST